MFDEMKAARQLEAEDMAHEVASSAAHSSQSVPFLELRKSVPSHVGIIPLLLDQLMSFIPTSREADENKFEIELALREALVNAIVHGNRENPYKRIHVICRRYSDGEVVISVRDQGQGFETSVVPDPTTPENRLGTHGRGIYLMKTLMDEVSFEKNGTVVRMRKNLNVRSGKQRRAE